MIRFSSLLVLSTALVSCAGPGPSQRPPARVPTPDYLRPAPVPYTPQLDACRANLYAGLVGQGYGSINFSMLPQPYRVIRPAERIGMESEDFLPQNRRDPVMVEITPGLPNSQIYNVPNPVLSEAQSLGPEVLTRMTVQLDEMGVVSRVYCG